MKKMEQIYQGVVIRKFCLAAFFFGFFWVVFWVFLGGGCFALFSHAARLASMILVPQAGIEPGPPAVEVWRPNHWTAREFSSLAAFFVKFLWPQFVDGV